VMLGLWRRPDQPISCRRYCLLKGDQRSGAPDQTAAMGVVSRYTALNNTGGAMRHIGFTIAIAMLLFGLSTHTRATAAEIAVLAAAAIEQPLETVAHAFERDTGTKVSVGFGSVGVIQNKLKAGAKPDLVILSTAAVAAAEKDGAVLTASRAVVGRAEIGVAVRDGTPAPDISTTDAFRKALLAAKSISFTDTAGGGTAAVFVASLLDRLGIADAVKKKAVPFNTGREVIAAVLKGDAELGIGSSSFRSKA
jgi:molybdate transport system substrate-binding protein